MTEYNKKNRLYSKVNLYSCPLNGNILKYYTQQSQTLKRSYSNLNIQKSFKAYRDFTKVENIPLLLTPAIHVLGKQFSCNVRRSGFLKPLYREGIKNHFLGVFTQSWKGDIWKTVCYTGHQSELQWYIFFFQNNISQADVSSLFLGVIDCLLALRKKHKNEKTCNSQREDFIVSVYLSQCFKKTQ